MSQQADKTRIHQQEGLLMRTTTYSRLFPAVLLTLLAAPGLAYAQAAPPSALSLTTGIALTSQYDDETHLGRGVLLSVGVSSLVSDHLRVEGDLSLARHHRNEGALEITGTPFTATARAAWMFGSRTSSVRPFVSAGVLVMHSRGDWVYTSSVPGPNGAPVVGQVDRRTWQFTKPGFETGLGMEVRGKGRMWWRPEARFSGTTGDSRYTPGVSTLETPILAIRAGLTVLW
jgi:hypothetical protein